MGNSNKESRKRIEELLAKHCRVLDSTDKELVIEPVFVGAKETLRMLALVLIPTGVITSVVFLYKVFVDDLSPAAAVLPVIFGGAGVCCWLLSRRLHQSVTFALGQRKVTVVANGKRKAFRLADYDASESDHDDDCAVFALFIEKDGRPAWVLGGDFPGNPFFFLNKGTPLGDIEEYTRELAVITAYVFSSSAEMAEGTFFERANEMALCAPLSGTRKERDEFWKKQLIPATVDEFFEKYWS